MARRNTLRWFRINGPRICGVVFGLETPHVVTYNYSGGLGTPGEGTRPTSGSACGLIFFLASCVGCFFEHFFRRLSIIKTVFADPANIDFLRILINVTGGN
jgi:hypothetical protein